MYHMSITHATTVDRPGPRFYARHGGAWCMTWCHHRMRLADSKHLTSGTFIRPDDVPAYERIGITHFKLDTRMFPTDVILDRARAFSERRWEGDLKRMMTTFHLDMVKVRPDKAEELKSRWAELSDGEKILAIGSLIDFDELCYMDNRALDGFLKRFEKAPCPPDCTNCNYCDQFGEKFLQWDEELRRKVMEAIPGFRKWLLEEFEFPPFQT